MICASVMLALFQVWPMIFGQRTGVLAAQNSVRPAPKLAPAAPTVRATPVQAKVSDTVSAAPKSCQVQYQAASSRCSATDQACNIRATDRWDICDATGFWPE